MAKVCPTCNTLKLATEFANKGRHTYCRDCMRERNMLAKYGLTPQLVHLMLTSQGDACAICRQPLTYEAVQIDHDHVTNIVRGLLCRPCNTGLGLFRDSPEVLRAAALYLEVSNALGSLELAVLETEAHL